MKIIFCNVAYLNYYDGRSTTEGELKPNNGGKFVKETGDAHEKWNFLNIDGYCYGYVQGNSDYMNIHTIDGISKNQASSEGVTVVWCANYDKKGTVIVGWYENATIYRNLRTINFLDSERYYWFKVKAEDAYLLPPHLRNFKVGRASQDGKGRGFGQQNYWFAKSSYAEEELIPKVIEMIESNRQNRINMQLDDFLEPEDLSPLSLEEEQYLNEMYKNLDDKEQLGYNKLEMKILNYGFRKFYNNKTAQNAYNVAYTLENLFQKNLAMIWYEKSIELEEDYFDSNYALAFVYGSCGFYDKAIDKAKKILEDKNISEDERDAMYLSISRNYYFKKEETKAIVWMDKILKDSSNKNLLEEVNNLKFDILNKNL